MASERYSDQGTLHQPRTPSYGDYGQHDHSQVKKLCYSPDIDEESAGYCIDWSNKLLDDEEDHGVPPSIDWEDICDRNLHSANEDSEADSNIIYQPESPASEEATGETDCVHAPELAPNSAWAILAKKVFSQFTTGNSKVETMVPPKEDTESHNSVSLKEKRKKKRKERVTGDESVDCEHDKNFAKKMKMSRESKRRRRRESVKSLESSHTGLSSHTELSGETHLELSQDLEIYDASSVIDDPMSENSAVVQSHKQISPFCNPETYDFAEIGGEMASSDCSNAKPPANTPPPELQFDSASVETIPVLEVAPDMPDDSLNWSNSKISDMIKHIRHSVERSETKKKPVLPDVCPRRLSVESNESVGTPELSYEVHGLEKMDTEEKFRNFLQVMRHLDGCDNPQLTIESALTTALRNTLDLAYDVQQLAINDMVFYSGVLTIGGYFLAQSIGDGKESVQQAIYEETFKILKTKSFREIIALKDPWIEQLKISLQTKLNTEFCLKDEVEKLSNYIKANEFVGDSEKAWFKAVKESGCLISPEISFAEKVRDDKVSYTAVLAAGNVFIAGCRGSNQQDMRQVCYSKGLHALKTKTVDTLLESHNLSLVLDKPTVAENPQSDASSAKNMSYEEKLEFIINHVRETVIHQSEIVPTLDKIMQPLGIAPKCVYLRMDDNDLDSRNMVSCELYFDELFISSGEGSFKRAAQEEAYIQAWELLPTATATILITENQRLKKEVERIQKMKDEEAAASAMIPDILMGERLVDRRRYQDSNIHLLEKYKKKKDLKRPLSDLVIVEKEDWMVKPVKFAFKTLLQSATLSGLLLEWEVHSQDGTFGCVMKIQNEIVSNASTKLKLDSRTVASVKALIKLVDTQPVYRITKNGIRKMIPWPKVESCAEDLQKSAKVNAGKCLKKFRVSPQLSNDKTEWLEQAFKQHILKTMPNSTLKDALVGPMVPEDFMERVKVRQFLAEHELTLTKNKDADEAQKQFVLLTWLSEPSRIVSILNQCGGLSGRYVLISREHAIKTYQDALKPS